MYWPFATWILLNLKSYAVANEGTDLRLYRRYQTELPLFYYQMSLINQHFRFYLPLPDLHFEMSTLRALTVMSKTNRVQKIGGNTFLHAC